MVFHHEPCCLNVICAAGDSESKYFSDKIFTVPLVSATVVFIGLIP